MRRFALSAALTSITCVAGALAVPAPPPAFRGPEAIARPLDGVLRKDGRAALLQAPDAWCPAGPGFQRWLEQRGIVGPTPAQPAASSTSAPSLAKSHDGTGPVVRLENGVVVMEDDGSLLRYDRRPDLENVTLQLVPQGAGYTVSVMPLAYETDIGAALFTGQRGWAEQSVDFSPLVFPFGGSVRSSVFVTSAMTLAFTDPAAPNPAQLHLNDIVGDRSPRIAPYAGGTSLYGWDAHYNLFPSRAVFTWIGNDGGGLDVNVQAVLFDDGRIRLTYRSLRGSDHGSVVVVDGNDAWWADRAPGGDRVEPAGDLDVVAPDGPAIDVVGIRAFQVGGSELLQVEVETAGPLPAMTDSTLQFAFELRDEPGGNVFNTLWAEWEDGRFNWANYAVEVVGSTMRFTLNRTDLPLSDDDVEVVTWTGQAWQWKQAPAAILSWPQAPVPLMRDFSAAAGAEWSGPLIESFTLPELQIGPVYDAFNRHFDSPRIDALAVYQNFATDIVFYAGAWSTVGNAGADGIGAGNATDPESPALLHMNALWYGWNSWDQGKVTVLNHEFGHHWLYFFSIDEAGTVSKPLGDGHPAGWVHTPAAAPLYNAYDASCMGGSTWTDNMDGTFTSAPSFASFGYSWPELYMMGLADPSEVGDFFYLRDANPGLPGAYWPGDNTTVTATRVPVTYGQIESAMGPRTPGRAGSRTEFIVPMVLVVRPGEVVQAHVDEVARTCAIWAPEFGRATAGRGSLVCNRVSLVDRPPVATILDPPSDVVVAQGGTVAFLGEGWDPDGGPVELTWRFDGAAPDATDEGPHDVTFANRGLHVVQLMARDAGGLTSEWPDVRVVDVTCAMPAVVTGLRVARDRAAGTLVFTWDPLAPAPDEYALFQADDLADGFSERGTGATSIDIAFPPGALFFYRVGARNLPDCLGPLNP